MNKMKSRKWWAFLWVMALESFILILAAIKMFRAEEVGLIGALTGFMISCFGAVDLTLAFYFATNVAQKKVTGPPVEEKEQVGG